MDSIDCTICSCVSLPPPGRECSDVPWYFFFFGLKIGLKFAFIFQNRKNQRSSHTYGVYVHYLSVELLATKSTMRTRNPCLGRGFESAMRDGENSFKGMQTDQHIMRIQRERGTGREEGNLATSEHANPVLREKKASQLQSRYGYKQVKHSAASQGRREGKQTALCYLGSTLKSRIYPLPVCCGPNFEDKRTVD